MNASTSNRPVIGIQNPDLFALSDGTIFEGKHYAKTLGAGTMKMEADEFHKLMEYTSDRKRKVAVCVTPFGLVCRQATKKKVEVFRIGPGQIVRSDLFTKNPKAAEARTVAVVMKSSTCGHPFELHILGFRSKKLADSFCAVAKAMVPCMSLRPMMNPPPSAAASAAAPSSAASSSSGRRSGRETPAEQAARAARELHEAEMNAYETEA